MAAAATLTADEPARPAARWSEVKQRQVIGAGQDERWRRQPSRPTTAAPYHQASAAGAVVRKAFVEPTPSPRGGQVVQAQWTAPLRDVAPAPGRRVRVAVQPPLADPFDDPFGDRASQPHIHRAADPQLPAAEEEPPVQPLLPPRDQAGDPPPVPPMPEEDTPPPSSGAAEDATQPCDRVYNRRDCCTEADRCARHRERVREMPLQAISLDVTPLMTRTRLAGEGFGVDPSTRKLDREDYERELATQLRRAPARIWRNRQGRVVADGRLVNYRRGRIEVETESGLERIRYAELSDDDMCFVTAWWSIPGECSLGDEEYRQRQWLATTMNWKPSGVCHKPLYFEEVQLERYGHTAGPLAQPLLSGAHFFLNIAALPYNMGIHPPNECRYPLGYYRPGSCAPWLVPPLPLSVRGGLIAAGTYVGGVFFIP